MALEYVRDAGPNLYLCFLPFLPNSHLLMFLSLTCCSLSQVRLILQKFLPPIFMEAVRDNAEASVTMFEGMWGRGILQQFEVVLLAVFHWCSCSFFGAGAHENPELIWNDESRNKVSTTVRDMRQE